MLQVGNQELAGFCHARPSLAVLALPGQDVPFVLGAITANQIGSHRQSYVNAILIKSRGRAVQTACDQCLGRRGLRPFPECRRLPGHFGGCCANCKWPDHAVRCSLYGDDGADSGDPDNRLPPPRSRSRSPGDRRTPQRLRLPGPKQGERKLLGSGTQQDPVVL